MDSPPPILSKAVERETSGSKVLWSARPDSWSYARTRYKQALIGIPFTAFFVVWTLGACGGFSNTSGKSSPLLFFFAGCMFIFFGLSMLLSPLFALWKAGRVFYVVTERSAIIFEHVWSLKIHSFDASALHGFERVSRGNRDGHVIFQRTIERRSKSTRVAEAGFFGLRDYAGAERALRSMMQHNAREAR